MTRNQKLALGIIEAKEQVKADSVKSSELYRLIESGRIYNLKRAELIFLCEEYDLTKSGKKADLVHRLRDYAEQGGLVYRKSLTKDTDRFSMYPTLFGYVCCDDLIEDERAQNIIAEYVAREQLHIPVLIGCIRRIANSGHTYNGTDACRQLVNSGFSEEIFEDMKQQVYMCVLSDIRAGKAWISAGKLRLANVNSVFSGIYQCLKDNKATQDDINRRGVIVTGYDKDGNEHTLDHVSDSRAVTMCAKYVDISSVLDNEEFNQFMQYVRETERPDTARNIESVLLCKFGGMTDKQCAEHLGLAHRTVQRYSMRIKIIWQLFTDDTPARAVASDAEQGVTWMPAQYDHGHRFGDVLTGYTDTGKRPAPMRGTGTGDAPTFTGEVRAVDREDLKVKTGTPSRLTKWEADTVYGVRITQSIAEKLNRIARDRNREYFQKHPERLLNPAEYPVK